MRTGIPVAISQRLVFKELNENNPRALSTRGIAFGGTEQVSASWWVSVSGFHTKSDLTVSNSFS